MSKKTSKTKTIKKYYYKRYYQPNIKYNYFRIKHEVITRLKWPTSAGNLIFDYSNDKAFMFSAMFGGSLGVEKWSKIFQFFRFRGISVEVEPNATSVSGAMDLNNFAPAVLGIVWDVNYNSGNTGPSNPTYTELGKMDQSLMLSSIKKVKAYWRNMYGYNIWYNQNSMPLGYIKVDCTDTCTKDTGIAYNVKLILYIEFKMARFT